MIGHRALPRWIGKVGSLEHRSARTVAASQLSVARRAVLTPGDDGHVFEPGHRRTGVLEARPEGHLRSLVELVADFKAAQSAHASAAVLDKARAFQRRGQFYVDFVESENSNGFHAPQEATRLLGEAIDQFRQGQVALRPLPGGAR